jgi:ribosomal protein S18 acetylase RimI-like enzyme
MITINLLSKNEMSIVREIARITWPIAYKNILSSDQLTFMFDWMYNLETLQNQAEEGHLFFVLKENETPLGFIGIESFTPEKDELKIHKIYVLPDAQGKGIGRKLIEKAIEIAQEKKIGNVILNVNRFNKAVSFYQKLGFNITSEVNIDIGKGYLMEDYIMKIEV